MRTTSHIKLIFSYIQSLNPSMSTVSSIGSFISNINQQVSDNVRSEVLQAILNKESLAYKMACDVSRFTEKQIWVIAYELFKNEEFVKRVIDFYDQLDKKELVKRQVSKDKIKANKESSIETLQKVKDAGRNLKDYYEFLKKDKRFSREFYSKKYSQESVNQFLNI